MTLYENQNDREAQSQVVAVVLEYLSGMPVVGTDLKGNSWFKLEETPQESTDSHDFNIWHQGKYIAVGEIKCRTGRYGLGYFKERGWMIAKQRLTNLRSWLGFGKDAMLVLRTSDGYVLFVMLTTLMKNGSLLKPAPDGACKNDHGSKPNENENGLIIPYSLLNGAGRCDT